jgi:hypothetical protein
MYLHAHDWTKDAFVGLIKDRGWSYGGAFVKVYATDVDPHTVLNPATYKSLAVVQSETRVFRPDEVFQGAEGSGYNGVQLEVEMANRLLEPASRRTVRALFRFAYAMGTVQRAMEFGMVHPLDIVDGSRPKPHQPWRTAAHIHLDVFSASALAGLQAAGIDYTQPGRVFELDAGQAFLTRYGASG